MRKLLTIALAGSCLLAFSTDAMAQRRGPKRIARIFAKLDTNKDGKISKAEAGKRWRRLGKADANKDGAVTKAELLAFIKKHHRKRGKRKHGKKKRG